MHEPDFVGVGVQCAGAGWWLGLLRSHPGVHGGGRRELRFFEGFAARPMTGEDVAAYHAQFERPAGLLAGEWTPRYMLDPWTPRLLRRAAPRAKLLVILRDPVERFRAGLAHTLGHAPGRKEQLVVSEAVERGRYATQLRRLLAHFPREQVLVLQYERCVSHPGPELARTLRFLGLAGDPPPVAPPAAEELGPPPWPDLHADLREVYAPEVRDLAALAPEIDVSLWPTAVR